MMGDEMMIRGCGYTNFYIPVLYGADYSQCTCILSTTSLPYSITHPMYPIPHLPPNLHSHAQPRLHPHTSPPIPLPPSLTILTASPTCLLTLTSLPFNLERIIAIMVNPWGRCSPLMTLSCYCSGSEDEESRFRCR